MLNILWSPVKKSKMLQLAFFILFFQAVFAVDSCPSKRTTSCLGISKTSNCNDYYEYSWNSTTLEPLARPKLCYAPSSGTKCATRAATYCEPPCMLNNMKVGADSTPQADEFGFIINSCASAYYDIGLCETIYVHEDTVYSPVVGDRWCYKVKEGNIFGPNEDGWVCRSPEWTCHD